MQMIPITSWVHRLGSFAAPTGVRVKVFAMSVRLRKGRSVGASDFIDWCCEVLDVLVVGNLVRECIGRACARSGDRKAHANLRARRA
jgi:hypothetical protein